MNNFKKFRNAQKINQKDFSKKLGISRSTLSAWETGRYQPDLESLIKISKMLNTSIDILLGAERKDIVLITRKDFETLLQAKNAIINIEQSNPQIKNKVKIQDNHGKITFN